MRLPYSNRRSKFGFDMTPMIDVVFLLIIFFLLSSHLARQESQLPMPLPFAESGHQPSEDGTPRVTINVFSDGRMLLAGKPVGSAQLQPRLRFEYDQRGRQLEIRIRSDRNVPYRFVAPILVAVARTGIWNVSFNVFSSENRSP